MNFLALFYVVLYMVLCFDKTVYKKYLDLFGNNDIVLIFMTYFVMSSITANMGAIIHFILPLIASGVIAYIQYNIFADKPKKDNDSSDKVEKTYQNAVNNLIGKTGKIVSIDNVDDKQYLGLLDDNGDYIVIYSKDILKEDDKFEIEIFENGKFYVKKVEKQLLLD